MPNGKPGDDWFTDIVAHGLQTFSAEADRLITEIADASAEPRPIALIALVNEELAKIDYGELSSRSSTVGMEYRNLRDGELRVLERGLLELQARLSKTD